MFKCATRFSNVTIVLLGRCCWRSHPLGCDTRWTRSSRRFG